MEDGADALADAMGPVRGEGAGRRDVLGRPARATAISTLVAGRVLVGWHPLVGLGGHELSGRTRWD